MLLAGDTTAEHVSNHIEADKCVLKRDGQKIRDYFPLKSNYDDLESTHTPCLQPQPCFFVGFYPHVLIFGVTASGEQ